MSGGNPPIGLQDGDAERVIAATTPNGEALKEVSEVSAEVVMLALRSRFNPLRGLTPQLLSIYLDQRLLGYVAYSALVWDQMEQRDDVIRNVSAKRKTAVSKLKRQSRLLENSPEAQRHAQALDYFYANLTAINALDQNEAGGIALLVRQMMDAVGKYYAVHEIVWMDEPEGLTAQLRFVPLWFFENRSGRLQFLHIPLGGANGTPLEPGGWMITKGSGIMEACSIAYMFKNMALKDWVSYSDKFGTPGVMGMTNAALGSPAFQAMQQAVAGFAQNWSAVIGGCTPDSPKEPIQLIQARGEGVLPFPPLVERMDRTMVSLWRGNDLSTMSADKKGASIQGDESALLLDDDAAMVGEAMQLYIDRWVIWRKFGVKPLAISEIVVPKTVNIQNEIALDEFLLKVGADMGMKATLDRYGRPTLTEDDTPLHSPVQLTQRIVDTETGDDVPVEPSGVKVPVQKVQAQKANARRMTAIVNELLDNKDDELRVSNAEWICRRMKAIRDAKTDADIAIETALSIKSLPEWANTVYPSNHAAAQALERAVVQILLT